MILADIAKRNCLETMLKRLLRWLEGPCRWINETADAWGAEVLWFTASALISAATASFLITGLALGATWWDLMTAFGTVGAVLTSLYLAKEKREKRQESASVYAVHLAKRLQSINRPLTNAWVLAAFDSEDSSENKYLRFADDVLSINIDVDLRDVAKSVEVGGVAAQRVSMAFAEIACLQKIIREHKKNGTLSVAARQSLTEWSSIAQSASDNLFAAINSLTYASSKYFLPPTGEEIHGDPDWFGDIKR